VDIAAYALPMIAVSAILVFQKQPVLRGTGYALAGMGFLFLGIHHMKVGFEAFRDQIDVARYALPGLTGLLVYAAVGAAATVVMQSSHATMVIVITALAAAQITYDNAIALAIGANIGTTITAVLGSLGANFQGKRLALAHLLFNLLTAAVALAFVGQLSVLVDIIAARLGIAADDYALKLAIFHTVFNLIGIGLMLPLTGRLVDILERRIPEPPPDISQPRYLNRVVDDFPETLASALRKEVLHLHENATRLVLHGLNLHREDVFESSDIAATVRASRTPIDLDIGDEYERRVKTLYAAIVDFATRAGDRRLAPEIAAQIDALRDMASGLVRAVKSVKHIRKNVVRYSTRDQGAVTDLYDSLRTEVARVVVVIRDLALEPAEARSTLSLDAEAARLEAIARSRNAEVGKLIRDGVLDASAATSFLNDSGYADSAMREFIDTARAYYAGHDRATVEVEELLALDEEEIGEAARTTAGQDVGEEIETRLSHKPASERSGRKQGPRQWD